MKILVINAGSSSLKYQLLDMEKDELMAKGLCERIGIDGKMKHEGTGRAEYTQDISLPTHADAIKAMIECLISEEYGVIKSVKEITALGHRVVHGGELFFDATLVTEEVIAQLEDICELAPLHNPAHISGIRACQRVLGYAVPQVLVFDTSFHQSMPDYAYLYALPYELYEDHKIRRYGFHGTSHRFVSQRAAEMLGKNIEDLKIITCHLGNGSSICAVSGGKSADTSMGFTPLEGVPMGTRCGLIDPSLVTYVMKKKDISAEKINDFMNKECGVLGISGVSSDFRDIETEANAGNDRCRIALDMFTYNVRKFIGSYAAAIGGVDAVVFTAGIGENSASIRKAVLNGLDYMGVKIDDAKNSKRGTVDISAADAAVKTFVIPTNEELAIAIDTMKIVKSI